MLQYPKTITVLLNFTYWANFIIYLPQNQCDFRDGPVWKRFYCIVWIQGVATKVNKFPSYWNLGLQIVTTQRNRQAAG